MNIKQLYKRLTTPKEKPQEGQESPQVEEARKQDDAALMEQERQKWLANYFTKALLSHIDSKTQDLLISARSSASVFSHEKSTDKLNRITTLNEIETYVRTGKI